MFPPGQSRSTFLVNDPAKRLCTEYCETFALIVRYRDVVVEVVGYLRNVIGAVGHIWMIRRQSPNLLNDIEAHSNTYPISQEFPHRGMLYHAGLTVKLAVMPQGMKMKESTLGKQDQLLVLGNGFDLQCGLKSAFVDFMKPRKALIQEADEEWHSKREQPYERPERPNGKLPDENHLAYLLWNKGLTAWDYILCEDKQKRTWYDVEECIRTWVDYGTAGKASPCAKHMQLVCSLHNPHSTGYEQTTAERAVFFLARDVYQLEPAKWNPASILSVLREELRRFEQAFSAYMLEQMRETRSYPEKFLELLTELVTEQPLDTWAELTPHHLHYGLFQSVSVLNFNYTHPELIPLYGEPPMLNVHGLIETGDIIFGMDGKNLDPDQDYYASTVKFTKTYRLMELSSRPHESLVHPYVAGSPDSATGIIKFYGHSLGDADYSYFQAIFDEVNLYESDTHLIFYYNQDRQNETVQAGSVQEEMFEKVNRLITTYGATLDNEDHGRNLLHKLLLEGRLTIKQAPIGPHPICIVGF